MSNFRNDDLFFDLEIRGNIFVNSQLYPKQKKIVVSFLEKLEEPEFSDEDLQHMNAIQKEELSHQETLDNEEENNFFGDQQDASRLATKELNVDTNEDDNPNHHWKHGFLQDYYDNGADDYEVRNNEKAQKNVAKRIKEVAKSVQDYEITFENLATIKGYLAFAKRYGIDIENTVYNQTKSKYKLGPFAIRYDTDDGFDPNTEGSGLRIGYNSINYDQSMIAHILGDLTNNNNGKENVPAVNSNSIVQIALKDQKIQHSDEWSQQQKNKSRKLLYNLFYKRLIANSSQPKTFLDPQELSEFNNKLFTQEYGMSSALGKPWDTNAGRTTYNAWNQSNRFVDVSALNPKRISLKRCAMALGYKIQESDTNREPTAPINSFDGIADLFAYNVNDIYVTMKLFESPEYMNRYTQNKQLLSEFPYLIYQQTYEASHGTSEKRIDYVIGQDHVRENRLTVNSTSTKFVTNAIAPYENTKIDDNPTLNLIYPDAKIAANLNKEGKLPKLFHGKPRNILDYIQDLLNDLLDDMKLGEKVNQKVQEQYDKIKGLYSQFIGQNFNTELTEDKGYKPAIEPKSLPQTNIMIKYINPNGNYVDKHDNGLASYINMSIGGTHGVEVREDNFEEEYEAYNQKKNELIKLSKFFNQTEKFDEKITVENLNDVIAQLKPDEPFTHVKKAKLPTNENLTFADIITSSSSRKNTKLKQIKEPTLFKKDGKIDDKYSYTSSDPSNHEDFDSYYPSLISQLAIFRNVDGDDIFTEKLYHPRLKLKKLAKTDPDVSKRPQHQLRQLSMKLLVNAASGGGDAKFNSYIKCNNKMMAMRIIGQLFCWYIGQTLALYGARIPSTNTDGLYAMNIENKLNDKIVEACAKRLILKLDPEHLQLFVSKDANNRLEKSKDKVAEARGSALTSWQGPGTQNSIDHPAIIDYVLAQYLALKPDACNQEFDMQFAIKILYDFVTNKTKFNQTNADTLRFFQFPLDGKPSSATYHFLMKLNDTDNEQANPILLNNTNRIFLVKRDQKDQNQYTVKSTGLSAVQKNTVKKRRNLKSANEATGIPFADIIANYSDPIAVKVIKANASDEFLSKLFRQSYNPNVTKVEQKPRDLKIKKISNLANNQPVKLYNEDLHDVSDQEFKQLMHTFDINAYLNIIEDKFINQWQN